ncbi:hypothetical protein MKX03_034055, partial [Papaver bracteatum]
DESAKIKRMMELMHLYNWDRKLHVSDGYADIKEDSDGMYVKILVPGLGKEDIKQVRVEQKLMGADESPSVSRTLKMTMRVKVLRGGYIIKNYTRPFFVEPDNYKFSHVWAEVYHGVLSIFIPKLKPAKIEDGIFDVNLE